MKSKVLVFACAFVLLFSTGAFALTTIDFEAAPVGVGWDGLTYAALGVTFQGIADPGESYAFIGLEVRYFGSPYPVGNVLSTELVDVHIIEAAFAYDTDFVQIENIISGIYASEVDVITASAFDRDGNLLGTVTQNFGDQFLTLSFAGMASVQFNDVAGYWGNGYVIDNLSFQESVPEPGTMLLVGTGLVCLAGLGRRKFFKK